MTNGVFVEFDEIDMMFKRVRKKANEVYENDGFVKQILHDVFSELDNELIRFEEEYKFKISQGIIEQRKREIKEAEELNRFWGKVYSANKLLDIEENRFLYDLFQKEKKEGGKIGNYVYFKI
jgi:hypothetical protein